MGGVNPNGGVAITDNNFRPEEVYSNWSSDEGLTRDECRLKLSFLISVN